VTDVDVMVSVAKAVGTFTIPAAVSATYSPTLTLNDLTLPANYAWAAPTTALSAGNWEYTATYTEPSGNYETASGEIVVNVAKVQVVKPTVANTALVYTGVEQSAVIAANAAYTITGDKGTNANNAYTATVTLKNKANYEWADGTTADLALTWEIAKASYNISGITFADKTVTYNGEPHNILISGTLPTGVTVSYTGNGKTAVGTYTVTASFTVDANHNKPADITATLTIEAIPTYTVTFNSAGGSAVPKQEIAKGNVIAEPPAPTKEGFTFLGWVKEVLGSFWDFATGLVSDITLTAVWEEIITPSSSSAGESSSSSATEPSSSSVTPSSSSETPSSSSVAPSSSSVIDIPSSSSATEPSSSSNSILYTCQLSDGCILATVSDCLLVNGSIVSVCKEPSSSSSSEPSSSSATNPSSSSYEASSSSDGSTPARHPQFASTRNILAQATGNAIVLQNLPQGAKVEAYNLQGKRIYFGNSDNSEMLRIPVQTKGMYIVKASSGSEKQILRIMVR
jgi:uncharacterized repeat protein (TIGR02543 family)